MRIIKNTNINFLDKTTISTIFSALLLFAGTISIVYNGGPKLSIDFKGGTLVAVNYTDTVNIEKIRDELSSLTIDGQTFDFSNAEIKYFGDESNIAVRVASIENEPDKFTKKFVDKMASIFPNLVPDNINNFVLSIEKVGPKVGAELSSDALMAILSALFFILVYVSVRFEFKYAVGAIAALTHDVLITLGIFSLLGYEVSLAVIAAFLTIVGYSLNDTIVIFDRVRENVKNSKNTNIKSIINKSINESLSRTIITSITTFFVVLILFLFGGEVIHAFSFAMIIGVLIGTYSSIFVASPVVVQMDSK
jgi:preprotein translocase SecF subunit